MTCGQAESEVSRVERKDGEIASELERGPAELQLSRKCGAKYY